MRLQVCGVAERTGLVKRGGKSRLSEPDFQAKAHLMNGSNPRRFTIYHLFYSLTLFIFITSRFTSLAETKQNIVAPYRTIFYTNVSH